MNQSFKNCIMPASLFDKVMARLTTEQRLRALRIRIGLFAFCAIISIVALVPALQDLMASKAVATLMTYLSYAAVEPQALVTYWQELLSFITESLPILSLTYVLGLVVAALWSVDAFYHDTSMFFKTSRAIK